PPVAEDRPVMPNILVVSGASRPESHLRSAVGHAVRFAESTGGTVRLCDLAATRLPIMEDGSDDLGSHPDVVRVRADARWAEGFVLVTPEYHGNMSGALKNWFDFLWLELAGKFAGVISVTGGGGGDMSIIAVKTCFAWCHGFTLPFHAAVRPDDFAGDEIVGPRVLDRIARICHDVARYAPVVHATFQAARRLGGGIEAGVAGMHIGDYG
ncbi:MAG TPA: NAD(P)H-dependent oxidoreductase, partial [Nannocystaceae bacterium]|nr:NAD(P)H-dependent oxidoreductase [Nannocystaceae bacterium]